MNQNLYYKYFLLILFTSLFGESFNPQEINFKENLILNEKEREYFLLYKDDLNYKITGPKRLEIISRRAIPESSNRKYNFGYILSYDDLDDIEINHKKYKKDFLYSKDHPGHGYTQAGKTILNIPPGEHNLKLIPSYRGKPVLVRIVKKMFKNTEGITEMILPDEDIVVNELQFNNKKRNYFEIEKNNLLSFSTYSNLDISFYGRIEENNILNNNFYQLEILENNRQKCFVVDFYNNESSKGKIFQLKSKDDPFSIKLIESSNPVHLRVLKNTPYD
ncbi:MAG: hypothetical protein CMG07_05645 [Candidatus Marinimicrobia bacterium]|nr:hypothetical protein [Candidatus Neomarinimicrobiota bacterium]